MDGPGVGFFVAPWQVLRGALFPVVLLSGGGGVRELSLEFGTLTAVDPEAILAWESWGIGS